MHSDKIILALLFAAGAVLNALFKKGGLLEQWRAKNNSTKTAAPPPERMKPLPASSEQDAGLRKLLEALGRPASDLPPPPLPPAPVGRAPVLTARPPAPPAVFNRPRLPVPLPPPLPSSLPPPPPPAVVAPDADRARRRAEQRKKEKAQAATLVQPPLPVPTLPAVRRQIGGSALRVQLATPGSVRQAILLAEILGPPRALRLPAANGQFT